MDAVASEGLGQAVRQLHGRGADLGQCLAPILGEPGPWATFQRPGDVVLTRGCGPASRVNQAVQSLLAGRPVRATHAMIVAAPGLYLDASPRTGVVLLPASAFAFAEAAPAKGAPIRRRCIAVLRDPGLAADRERHRRLLEAAARQLGQPYNFRLLLKGPREPAADASAFCSELVARTLALIGITVLPGRRHAAVLPDGLGRALRRAGWQEIGQSYRAGLAALPRPALSSRAAAA